MKPPANGSAASTGTFEDFEPFSKWQKDPEGHDILVLQVPDFKKEHMKVHVSSRGLLKLTGERPLDSFKRKRFHKSVDIPKDCDHSGIRAKLTHSGDLHIVMPKKTTPSTQDGATPSTQDGASTSPVNLPAPPEIIPQLNSQGTMASRVFRLLRWDWKVAAAALIVAVAVALGSYVAHKYRHPVVGPSHSNYSSDL